MTVVAIKKSCNGLEEVDDRQVTRRLAKRARRALRLIETFASDGAKLRKFTKADCLAWLNLAQETAWADLAISPAAREMLYNAIQTILENDPQ